MTKIRYLSLFSGIEAFSCAVKDMPEFEPVAFAEIEPFPCAVLAHHYPDVPNLGDVTKIDGRKYRGLVDLIVGGSPCQGFSVAGQRKGLDDERSCLALTYVRLVEEMRAKWILWENVPGCTSTNGGEDLRTFIAALADIGYSLSWTVLDSQYFGVAQRRRRVFLVGCLGTDWERPAKVLLEPESMCGNPPPRRKAGEGDTGPAEGRAGVGGEQGSVITPEADGGCATISAKWSKQAGGFAGDEYHNLVGEPEQNPTFATLCASGAGCDRPSAQGSQLDYLVQDVRPEQAFDVCGTLPANGAGPDRPGTASMFGFSVIDVPKPKNSPAYAIRRGEINANGIGIAEELSHTIAATGAIESVAFAQNQRDELRQMEVVGAPAAEPGMHQQTFVVVNGDAKESKVSPTLGTDVRNGPTGRFQAQAAVVEMQENEVCPSATRTPTPADPMATPPTPSVPTTAEPSQSP